MSGCGNVNIVSRRCINITHCANNNNNFRTSIAPNIHVQRRNKQNQGVLVVRSSHSHSLRSSQSVHASYLHIQ